MDSKLLNRPLLFGCILAMACLPSKAPGQNFAFETDAQYREALSQLAADLRTQLNLDVDEVNDEKLLRMMRESNVNNCIMKLWEKQMRVARSQLERKQFAVKFTQDLSQRIELVDNYLKDFGGSDSRRLALAKRIARDADSTIDVMKTVLPKIEQYLGNGKGSFSDGLGLVEQFYDGAFKSICAKLAEAETAPRPTVASSYGNSVLAPDQRKRYEQRQRYSSSYRGPTPAYVPTPQEANQKIPNMVTNAKIQIERGQTIAARVVQSEKDLCSFAQFIHKCYEFRAIVSETGQSHLYHGNLYADCSGYIMVAHPKR